MFGNNLPKQIELDRTQRMPDHKFPQGHAAVFKLVKWFTGGARGLTVQTMNKDPKKVCERAYVRDAQDLQVRPSGLLLRDLARPVSLRRLSKSTASC